MPIGKFIHVNSKGSYLWQRFPGLKATAPTTLQLQALGVGAGDWIGLRGVGTFSAGAAFPGQTGIGGCFFGAGKEIPPARGGNDEPIITPPVYPSGQPTNIAEDFAIRRDETKMVRVPVGATELRLGPPDAYFPDNGNDATYGCQLTLPNRKLATPRLTIARRLPAGRATSSTSSRSAIGEWHERGHMLAILNDASRAVSFPTATAFSAGPFDIAASPATRAHWRGWYRSSGTNKGVWLPQWSYWKANRNGKTHWGWDIFAPRRAKLIVPVAPSYLEFIPNVSGYGNIVAFRFKSGGKEYSAIYAHCDGFIGKDARIAQLGEEIATAGCSGNAAHELCGNDLAEGGRTDHVHVGLYEGEQIGDKYKPLDPGKFFAWNPLLPT